MADLEYRDTPEQIDRETLFLLGADLAARGFKVPRVTVAGVALLDLIDSPFLTGKREPELMDVFRALYVLERQSEAADAIMGARRACDAVHDAHRSGAQTAENHATYLAAAAQVSQAWAEFDKEVMIFGDGCGQFDISAVVLGLRDAISRSCGGFAMIAKSDGDTAEKKTAPAGSSTANGLRGLWRRFRQYLTHRRMKLCS